MAGLTNRLGDEGSTGEGSKVILRGPAFVTMWMRVLPSETGKTGFGMLGKPKLLLLGLGYLKGI